jgi:hypothetical protein
MYQNLVWPGAYSFINEIHLFINFIKKEIEELEAKIAKVD